MNKELKFIQKPILNTIKKLKEYKMKKKFFLIFALTILIFLSQTISAETILLEENFENGLPNNWLNIDQYNNGNEWQFYNNTAIIDTDFAELGEQVSSILITEPIDCSDYESVFLSFNQYYLHFHDIGGGNSSAFLLINYNLDDNWIPVEILFETVGDESMPEFEWDISDLAAGHSTIYLAWAFSDGNNVNNVSCFWKISNITVWAIQDDDEEEPIYQLPFYEDFTGTSFPPENWMLYEGLLTENSILNPGGYWDHSVFANQGDPLDPNNSAFYDFWNEANDWLISPTIDLGTGGNFVRFEIAKTGWENTEPEDLGEFDFIALVVSTDNGETWSESNVIADWNSDSEISHLGQEIILDISDFTGLVKFGLYVESPDSGFPNPSFFFTNFEIYPDIGDALTDFFENFDTTAPFDIPEGWSSVIASQHSLARVITIESMHAFSPPNLLLMSHGNDYDQDLILVTPPLTNFNQNILSFWVKPIDGNTENGTLAVGIMDEDIFTPFHYINITSGQTYIQHSLDFDIDSHVAKIGFKYEAEGMFNMIYLEDIFWGIVEVFPPQNVIASVDYGSITIEWDPPSIGAVNGYNIYRNGEILNSYIVTDNYFIDTDLELDTSYMYYVKSVNNDFEESDPSNIVEIYHEGRIENLPFFEGFENDFLPKGWSEFISQGSALNGWFRYSGGIELPENAYSGNYNAILSNSNTDNPHAMMLVTPKINLSGITYPVLSFWHAQARWLVYEDELSIYYRSNPDDLWIMLENYDDVVYDWTQRLVELPQSSDIYQIAFEGYVRGGDGVCLDNIVVFCGTTPFNLTALNLEEGIQLNWSPPPYPVSEVLGYNIYKNEVILNNNPVTETMYSDYEVEIGNSYTYYVTAIYESGESEASNSVNINMEYLELMPPINLNYLAGDGFVNLYWETPEDNYVQNTLNTPILLGYNVYREEEILNVDTYPELFFFDNDVLNGETYTYYVTAVYNVGESDLSNIVIATPTEEELVILPPENLSAEVSDTNNVLLNWDAPVFEYLLSWDSGVNHDGIGTSSSAIFDVAQRFTASQLQDIGAGNTFLREIRFFPREENSTYRIRVWTGGTTQAPGELIVDQLAYNVNIMELNNVLLLNPVFIDGTTDLWFGYQVDTEGGYPAGCDEGPAQDGYGNMINLGGWTTTMEWEINVNWNIQAYLSVTNSDIDSFMLTVNHPVQENKIQKADFISRQDLFLDGTSNSEITPSNSVNQLRSRYLTGYKIFRNNSLLAITDDSTLSYIDENLEDGTYFYYVKAIYGQIDSDQSNSVEIEIDTSNTEGDNLLPIVTSLNKNYPNPFNPVTSIKFAVKTPGNVKIEIYNILGQKIKTLINDEYEPGWYTVVWNGKDERDRHVGSGIYFYRMTTKDFNQTKKMVLTK